MISVNVRQQLLADSLTAAGLSFLPVDDGAATFAVDDGHGRPISVLAQHTGEVVRFVARDALAGALDPQLIADRDLLSQAWGLGRAYFDPTMGRWSIGLGLRSSATLARDAVLLALQQLSGAARAYAQGIAPTLLVDRRFKPADVMPRVESALTAAGIAGRPALGGEMFIVRAELQKFGAVGIELFVDREGAQLILRARPLDRAALAETPERLVRMNELNARLEIGAAGFSYGQGLPIGWLGLPLNLSDIDSDLMRWSLDRAGQIAGWAWRAASAA